MLQLLYCTYSNSRKFGNLILVKTRIRSMERGICPIATRTHHELPRKPSRCRTYFYKRMHFAAAATSLRYVKLRYQTL